MFYVERVTGTSMLQFRGAFIPGLLSVMDECVTRTLLSMTKCRTLRRADIATALAYVIESRVNSNFCANRPMYNIDPVPYFISAFCVLYGVSLLVVAMQ